PLDEPVRGLGHPDRESDELGWQPGRRHRLPAVTPLGATRPGRLPDPPLECRVGRRSPPVRRPGLSFPALAYVSRQRSRKRPGVASPLTSTFASMVRISRSPLYILTLTTWLPG